MFERFTEKTLKVIMMAQEESRRMDQNFVGTEQILLGLCGEGTGIAARVLRAHDIRLKDLRATVLGIIGKGSGNVSVEIPFTLRAKKLLEASWNIARDMEHTYIGTEHLLLGLLEVDGAVAKQVLSKHNVDLEKIRIDVLDFVQTAKKHQQMTSANQAHSPPPPSAQTSAEVHPDPMVESGNAVKSQALVRSAKGPIDSQSAKEQVAKSNVADLFSDHAIIAMQLAQQEARRVGRMKLELQHLLLGILSEGRSEAARLLSGQSIALEELRLATTQEEGEMPSESASLDFELSKQALFTVEMASVAARRACSSVITPEHLLLSLLSYEESRAVNGLQKLGVNIELFVDDLRKVIQELDVSPGKIAQEKAAEENTSKSAKDAAPVLETEENKEPVSETTAKQSELLFTVEDGETGAPVNLSNRTIETVMAAMAQAHALGHNFVSTEFLLLGLFSPTGGMARHALMNYGASEEMVQLVIERLLGRGPGSTDLPVPSTSNAREAFKMALGHSILFSSAVVEPEHLLLGLLEIKNSTAYRILDNLGVDPAAVCARVVSSISPLSSSEIKVLPQPALALTGMVEHAIVLAKEEAHTLGHVEVDTDHVLLGLMAEADGLASLALHVWDVKPKELRQESANMPGREKSDSPCESRCGSKVNELILAARQLARESELTYVGTDHVLLALLADEDSAGLKVLRNLSIDIGRLQKMLQNANLPPRMDAKYSALVPLSKQRGFERFSDEAIKALMFAREEASRLGHCQIDSQFLLLGICDERLNKGAERLRKIGISLDDLRFEVEHITGHGEGIFGSDIVFAERSLKAIRWSFNTVVTSGIEVIRPEHLFIALILEESGPAFNLLQQFNVSIERLRANTSLKLKKRKLDSVSSPGIEQIRTLLDSRCSYVCDLLSLGAINSILRGQQEAKALSQELLEPCHILLGLLGESTGMALQAAQFIGLELDQLRLGLQRLNGKIISSPEETSLSISTVYALGEAHVLAELCKSNSIEPDHLLFAILKDRSCLNLFNDANQDYKKFYDTALELLKASKPKLFPQGEQAQESSATPPFFKLTDNDIDQIFGRAVGNTDKFAMWIFTATAQSAIRLAVVEARRLGRSQVGTDLLLVGILSGEDSAAATALEAIGITRSSLRTAIEREFEVADSTTVEDLPFSKNAILCFEKAFEAAKSFGAKTIGTDQLLIGILGLQKVLDRGSFSREDCAAVTVLRSLGIDLAYLRQLVLGKMIAPQENTIKAVEAQALPQSKRVSYSAAAIKRFDNFAADALKAVLIAHEEARENHLSLVGTEQILLALVLDTEAKAGVILQSLGLTAERVRDDIERFVQTGPGLSALDEPYTSEAKSVFYLARQGAEFVEGKVGTEHLLLSIITNQKSLASIILDRAGIDVLKLQEVMADEQTKLSELVEKTAAAKKSGENFTETLPAFDYQAALRKSGGQVKESDSKQGAESHQGPPAGDVVDQSCEHQEGDWAALKERFTANLRTVIDGAKADSCRRGNGIVNADNLMFALLNLPTSSCADYLKALLLDRFSLRDKLNKLMTNVAQEKDSAYVGFSPLAQQALLRAFQLSRIKGGGWVQTQHLLMALMQTENEEFMQLLLAVGLRPYWQSGGYTLKPSILSPTSTVPDFSQATINQDTLSVTATAERAMKFAASEAKQMGYNFVGTEQVMLGLIAAGDSVAGQVLLSHGLTLIEVRRRVRAIIGLGAGAVADEVPFTPRTKKMLDLALNEAQRLITMKLEQVIFCSVFCGKGTE